MDNVDDKDKIAFVDEMIRRVPDRVAMKLDCCVDCRIEPRCPVRKPYCVEVANAWELWRTL